MLRSEEPILGLLAWADQGSVPLKLDLLLRIKEGRASVVHKLSLCDTRRPFRISAMRQGTVAVNYTFLAIQQVILISCHCKLSRVFCTA
jgi:hypothetical protein